jgi:protein gp37
MGQSKYRGTTRASGGRAKWNGKINLDHRALVLPKTWKTGKMIFVNSMSDLFHEKIPSRFIQDVFSIMNETPHHTYQILTKRAERVSALSKDLPWTRNIWLGVGPLDDLDLTHIDWAIVGGESGPNSRPMRPEWVRSIRDQCKAKNVAFHFKQWGGVNKKLNGRILDGRTWNELPQAYGEPNREAQYAFPV